jgi:hypothetical protein
MGKILVKERKKAVIQCGPTLLLVCFFIGGEDFINSLNKKIPMSSEFVLVFQPAESNESELEETF